MAELAVWAEKYRPIKLSEVINQKHVVERVKAFVKEKNIPHMLFAGPAGSGKTTVALCIAHELYGNAWRQNVLELNASVTPETPIMIRKNSKIERINFEELSKEYFKSNSSNYSYPNNLEILTLDKNFKVGFKPVKNISRHKAEKVAKIIFEGGSVRTTLNHSVMIINEDGEIIPKRVEELRENDLLITFTTVLKGKEKFIDIENYAPEEFHTVIIKGRRHIFRNLTVKTIVQKLKLMPEIAWMMGNYLAEGTISIKKNNSSGSVIFTYGYPYEKNVAQYTSEIFKNFFCLPSEINPGYSGFDRSRMSSIQLRIFSTQFARFFRDIFYSKDPKRFIAKNKRVPSLIFNSTLENREAFLQGYMGDASGEWGRIVRYISSSIENLIDIAWLGRISGFETSFFGRETRVVWEKDSSSYVRSELLPSSIALKFFEKIKNKIKFNYRYQFRHQLYYKKCKRISKSILRKVLTQVDQNKLTLEEKHIFKNLTKLVNSPISVVKIKKISIEKYRGYVYDVSVPEVEAFFGGSIPILLHNSDARGIDVIRGQVKDFARTKAISEIPYKIILLDEADNLTPDAQQALRRTMENYTSVSRFILIGNYSSKIIEPIQSRCAVFRFKALSEADIRKFIERIVSEEKLKITEDAIKAIIYLSEGDLRKVANLLQASAALEEKITEEIVYDVASKAKPTDVKEMLELALKGKFEDARKKLQDMLLKQGLAGSDIISEIHKQIYSLDISEEAKVQLIDKCGEFDFRLSEGANELIQLESLLAQFLLFSKAK